MSTTSKLTRGDVVLTTFPFTNLSGAKVRPALIISPGEIGRDVILAAISSVSRSPADPFDYALDVTHVDFKQTGLRVSSVIRTHKPATVESQIIVRRLGKLGTQSQTAVDQLLRRALSL